VKANVALINWREGSSEGIKGLGSLRYGRNLRMAFRLGCNLVVLSCSGESWKRMEGIPPESRRVDLWWFGDASSRLMLLLAHLIRKNENWSGSALRILAASFEEDTEKNRKEMQAVLDEARISGEIRMVPSCESDSIPALSSDACLLFMPFRLKGKEVLDPFGRPMHEMISALPVTCMVLAAEDIDLDAEPEEGKAGEMASASDALADALKRAGEAEKEALHAGEEAEMAMSNLINALSIERKAPEQIRDLEEAARRARNLESLAARRAAKAQAKLETAEKEAEKAGVTVTENEE
jgi:hypothetical protein